ncbi:MAG: hypothetical protein KGL39_04080 [Patescibacteria group bacterium]|nr:hypothetical protein [Patescibacteria group bacterium]
MTTVETSTVTCSFELPAVDLQRVIHNTLIFQKTDDINPILCGSLLRVREGELEFVSTDSYCLGFVPVPGEFSGAGLEGGVFVDDAACKGLLAFAKGATGRVTVDISSSNYATHVIASTQFGARQEWSVPVVGTYPRVDNLIPAGPAEPTTSMAFNPAILARLAKIWPAKAPKPPTAKTVSAMRFVALGKTTQPYQVIMVDAPEVRVYLMGARV